MSIEMFSVAWKINFQGRPLKKLVLLSLADQANDRDGYCWPTYETIAKRCGMSRRTVINTVAELELEGFIRRESRFKVGGLHTSNAFWVNLQAMQAAVAADIDGEPRSPLTRSMVNVEHHNGEPHSPSIVNDDHHNGDPRSPITSIEPSFEPKGEPPTAASQPALKQPAQHVAVVDAFTAILDWIGFDDALTPKERSSLDKPTLLAWAYWVQLKRAERSSRIYNPIGLVRAQWRSGKQPRSDLLALARSWIAFDNDHRSRLLGRLEWAGVYAAYDPGDPIDDEFPNLPLSTAAAVFAATGGELGPPCLSPPIEDAKPNHGRQILKPSPRTTPETNHSSLWDGALVELEMQMPRGTFSQWLRGTTATETETGLIVHVRNPHAVDWLSYRLHPLIQRTVDGLVGRSLPVHYAARSEAVC